MGQNAGFGYRLNAGNRRPRLLFQQDFEMFDDIEKLKTDFTDQYVVVDAAMPELARFEGHVGQVKTVNMSGRALVQFEAWNNIGWYDIDVDFLKVVPKPAEAAKGEAKHSAPAKAAAAAPKAAVTGEKKLSPIEMARMQGASKGAAAKPAAAPAAKAAAPAAGGKSSTADILAAARASKAAASARPKPRRQLRSPRRPSRPRPRQPGPR